MTIQVFPIILEIVPKQGKFTFIKILIIISAYFHNHSFASTYSVCEGNDCLLVINGNCSDCNMACLKVFQGIQQLKPLNHYVTVKSTGINDHQKRTPVKNMSAITDMSHQNL